MPAKIIPDIVIGRMPIYLRALTRKFESGRTVTSSQELGERLGISAAQIRKDLSQFGEFGKQGTGYNIEFLIKKIQEILNVNRMWDVAVIGAGYIGHAVAHYGGFHKRGFQITKIFDNDPEKIGTEFNGIKVQDIATMKAEIQKSGIRIAMVTVPAEAAQDVADQLVEAGV